MGNNVILFSKQQIIQNPHEVANTIVALSHAIEDAKVNIESIKNRNYWQRLINNNTRDMADALLKQNDTISAFLNLIQGVIFLTVNNLQALLLIQNSLNKHSETDRSMDNALLQRTKECFQEAINTARSNIQNTNDICKVKQDITAINQNNDIMQQEIILLHNEVARLTSKLGDSNKYTNDFENLKSQYGKSIAPLKTSNNGVWIILIVAIIVIAFFIISSNL